MPACRIRSGAPSDLQRAGCAVDGCGGCFNTLVNAPATRRAIDGAVRRFVRTGLIEEDDARQIAHVTLWRKIRRFVDYTGRRSSFADFAYTVARDGIWTQAIEPTRASKRGADAPIPLRLDAPQSPDDSRPLGESVAAGVASDPFRVIAGREELSRIASILPADERAAVARRLTVSRVQGRTLDSARARLTAAGIGTAA